MSSGDDYDDEVFDFDESDFDESDFENEAEVGLDDEIFDDSIETLEANTAVPKKKLLDFNTIVIIGGVIVGGLIMMSQINSKNPAPHPASQEKFASAVQMEGAFKGPGSIAPTDNGQANSEVASLENTQGGFLFDSNALDIKEDIFPDEEGLNIQEDVSASLEQDSLPQPLDNTIPLSDEALDRGGNILEQGRILSEDRMVANATEDIDNSMPTLLEDQGDFIEQQEEVLQEASNPSKIDILDLDPVIEEPIQEIVESTELEIIKSTDVVQVASNDVELLQSRLSAMELEMSKSNANYEETIRELESKISKLEDDATKPRSVPVIQKRGLVKKKPTVSSPSMTWTLKAAQPGKAWVSKRGGKKIVPVVVGDELPGLGKIKGITYQNHKWSVVGSVGKITQ